MKMAGTSPYRTAAEQARRDAPDEAASDTELLPVFVLVWIASLLRVVAAVVWRETLGVEATLAALFVVALPVLAREGLRDRLSRWTRGGPRWLHAARPRRTRS